MIDRFPPLRLPDKFKKNITVEGISGWVFLLAIHAIRCSVSHSMVRLLVLFRKRDDRHVSLGLQDDGDG